MQDPNIQIKIVNGGIGKDDKNNGVSKKETIGLLFKNINTTGKKLYKGNKKCLP